MASFWAATLRFRMSARRATTPEGLRCERGLRRPSLDVLRPQLVDGVGKLHEALDLVRLQRLVHGRAPGFQAVEVLRVELLGHLVGVVGHAGVGQQEVIDLIGLADRALAGRAGAGLRRTRPVCCPSSDRLAGKTSRRAPIRLLPEKSW